ncbi:tetratricopeptide repeat-containing sensor histidine kinase [Niabella beijingensis]|uniref:tetratricopeptide repeat-containing sensor histidine kinase n=1 Tax=Niabella beijingensis TaxID=2872700 RepID=UPI001CBD9FBB|nr:ATP-binding protein [Niabella beijingensis]MBZ4189402.1 hypothetical protein [Niabella beijingensis]
MRLLRSLICLSCIFPLLSNAQQYNDNYKDSLQHVLTINATDSIKARACFLLSYEWSYTDTVKARQFLELGTKFSGNNKYLHALSACYAGFLFFDTDTKRAERLFLRSDSLLTPFTTPEAYLFRSKCWRNYGALRLNANDSKTMLAVLITYAIPFAIKSGDKEYLAKNYADIGLVFMNQLQYDKAETYYDKAISILQQTGKSKLDNMDIFINAARNLLYINKLSEAKELIDDISPFAPSGTVYETDVLMNTGIYLIESNQHSEALKVLDEALSIAHKLQNADLAERIMFEQYRAYSGLGNYKKAIVILLRLVKNPARNSSQNKLMIYQELATAYEKNGNTKAAYKWQKEYSRLLDSVDKSKLKEEINGLEIKFHSAENQKRITELNASNITAKLTAKNSRLVNWLLGSISLLLLATVLFVLVFYRNSKQSSIQKAQIEITKAVVQAQEGERTRIARDLHDGLGGMLTTTKLNLERVAYENGSHHDNEIRNILRQLDNSVLELRRIARNMMPEMLLKLGLEAALRDLCKLLVKRNLHINFQFLGEENAISMETKIIIYRIVQELLTNCVKHANAQHVMLQCAQHGSVFFITVEDDGRGFDNEDPVNSMGVGLSNIQSRVAYLNGKMEVLSKNRQGTSVNIEIYVTS